MTGVNRTKDISTEPHRPAEHSPPRAQSPLPELKPAGRNIRRPAIHDPIKRSNAISGSRTAAAGSRGGRIRKTIAQIGRKGILTRYKKPIRESKKKKLELISLELFKALQYNKNR